MPLHSTHITLLLSSMELFPEANAAYVQYFGTSPPSRACVAIPLPEGERIRVEVVGFDDQAEGTPVGGRTALHVQGLSYWAPANIGPYSQAVTVSCGSSARKLTYRWTLGFISPARSHCNRHRSLSHHTLPPRRARIRIKLRWLCSTLAGSSMC